MMVQIGTDYALIFGQTELRGEVVIPEIVRAQKPIPGQCIGIVVLTVSGGHEVGEADLPYQFFNHHAQLDSGGKIKAVIEFRLNKAELPLV